MDHQRKPITVSSLILWLYSLFALFVLAYMTYQSLRPKSEILSKTFGLPDTLSFGTYARLFSEGHFHIYFMNSVIIVCISLLIVVMLSSMVAYGIGRFQFRFKKGLLIYFLLGMMFPVQLGIVPIFIIIRSMGLLDTHAAIILILSAGLSMAVFLLTVFFQRLPKEIYESAKVDGAGEWTTFMRVMFPLASPVVFSICIIMSVQIWNQFFVPLIFLQSEANKTIPLMIMKYTTNLLYTVDLALGASVISTVPILIAFFFFSKRIMDGVAAGGVKG
ncbi:carbohydrate ABC transporter permease [Paenibacillus nasutitermitis]|uniref:Sugar ABC transporter permease n=1 Tax=Paenibacillus nasutitermitis TaxID=1652958 RepID=A0A916ZFB4_9BACL|nr:carbohydrate ABC transporter permease [Paenibacillus nasutitermitis]GGD93833.1 sugar ABC transporter permease [Paenibacillus nasutitermitis]